MSKIIAVNFNSKNRINPFLPEERHYKGLSLKLEKICPGNLCITYHYEVTNISRGPIYLTQQPLCLPGDVTLACELDLLEPGESAWFFVMVTRKDENDFFFD